MTLTVISTILILLSLWSSYRDWKSDNSVIKKAYFNNLLDWMLSLLIVVGVMFSFLISYSFDLPGFLTWTLFSGFSSESSGNLIFTPFSWGITYVTIFFYLLLVLAVPYLAKSEEVAFRQNVLTIKSRVFQSLIFGLIHMLVGVPLIAALILSVVGYIYSYFYVKEFNKFSNLDSELALKKSLDRSTSIHAKYNFIIITFIFIVILLSK